MPVTLKDVARHAGVSHKTVSRVVNNQGEISEATRQRVLRAVERLGYKPNRLARGLVTGRTQAVGIIIPDITDPFFPEMILGAESVARERGYNVFLCNTNRDPALELRYVDLLSERQVDGLMIVGSMLGEDGLRTATRGHNAVILTPHIIPDAVLFWLDDLEGGRQIGRHLVELGHQRIGFIEASWRHSANYRCAGLLEALQEGGLPADALLVETISVVSVDAGRQAARDLLARSPAITALACYNDVIAVGALQACRELGKRVPQDLSVTGFDDILEASRSHPPLTTYRFDRHGLGAAMTERLLDMIEHKSKGGDRLVVRGELIVRDSSGPAVCRGAG